MPQTPSQLVVSASTWNSSGSSSVEAASARFIEGARFNERWTLFLDKDALDLNCYHDFIAAEPETLPVGGGADDAATESLRSKASTGVSLSRLVCGRSRL